jgi:hypothetical protein
MYEETKDVSSSELIAYFGERSKHAPGAQGALGLPEGDLSTQEE